MFIISGHKKIVFINNRIICFHFNDSSSIGITSRNKIVTIRAQEEKNVLLFKVGIITLKKVEEVDIDGMFNIEKFLLKFLIPKKLQFYIETLMITI